MKNNSLIKSEQAIVKAKFFQFHQNNSGGSFAKPAMNVWIQAISPAQANEIAEQHGLYWNGVDEGRDCECCGDRWHPQWADAEGDDVPSEYGTPLAEMKEENLHIRLGKSWQESDRVPFGMIVYLDGNVEMVVLK